MDDRKRQQQPQQHPSQDRGFGGVGGHVGGSNSENDRGSAPVPAGGPGSREASFPADLIDRQLPVVPPSADFYANRPPPGGYNNLENAGQQPSPREGPNALAAQQQQQQQQQHSYGPPPPQHFARYAPPPPGGYAPIMPTPVHRPAHHQQFGGPPMNSSPQERQQWQQHAQAQAQMQMQMQHARLSDRGRLGRPPEVASNTGKSFRDGFDLAAAAAAAAGGVQGLPPPPVAMAIRAWPPENGPFGGGGPPGAAGGDPRHAMAGGMGGGAEGSAGKGGGPMPHALLVHRPPARKLSANAAAAQNPHPPGGEGPLSSSECAGDRTWMHRFEELRAYRALHGHCNVPRVFPSNPSLASWVHNQRKDYKRLRTDRKSAMTPTRVRYLEEMGFEWNQQGANWDRRFDELVAFKAKEGHTNVPQRYGENAALGRWVNTQRLQQRLRKQGQNSDMTEERYQRLSELGFVWYVKGPDQWMDRFHELEAYKRKFGNCDVPSRYTANRKLGRWVSFQRTQYRLKKANQHNHLTEERAKALDQLGFSWTAPCQSSEPWVNEIRATLEEGKQEDGKGPPQETSEGKASAESSAPSAGMGSAALEAAEAAAAAPGATLPEMLETSASSMDASKALEASASSIEAGAAPAGERTRTESPSESAAELLKTAELHTSSDDDNERMEDIQEEPTATSSGGDGRSSSPSGDGNGRRGRSEEPESKVADTQAEGEGKRNDEDEGVLGSKLKWL